MDPNGQFPQIRPLGQPVPPMRVKGAEGLGDDSTIRLPEFQR